MTSLCAKTTLSEEGRAPFFSDDCGTISHDWKKLSSGKPVDLSYLNDYLRYQTPLTQDTFAKGVTVSDPKLDVVLCQNPSSTLTQSKFRDIIEGYISSLKGKKVAFHLSGGLDSGLLVLLAGRLLDKEDCIAVSCRTLGSGASDELETAQKIATQAGIKFEVFDFTEIDLFVSAEEFIQHGPGYPLTHPSHLTRYLIDKKLSETPYKTIVTGRGPDEVLGGYAWHSKEFNDFETHHKRVQATPQVFLDQLFKVPVKSKAFKNYQSHFKGGHDLNTRMEYDLKSIFLHWDIIDAALSQSLGVEYISPFLDETFLSEAINLPEKLRTFSPPRGKEFMIETFHDIYPEFMLKEQKKGLSFDMGSYLRRYDLSTLFDRIYEGSHFNTETFDRNTVKGMLEDTLNKNKNYGWQIWGLMLTAIITQDMKGQI